MIIYLIHETTTDNYKIGRTKNQESLKKRRDALQTANSNRLEVIHAVECQNEKQLESTAHRIYKLSNKEGEWFTLTPTEVDNFVVTIRQLDRSFSTITQFGNPFLK